MRPSIASASLRVAAVLVIAGGFMLCACPGMPALGAVFAVIAAFAGTGRTRIWAFVWLVLCLIGIDLQLKAKYREQEIEFRVERLNARHGSGQTNAVQK